MNAHDFFRLRLAVMLVSLAVADTSACGDDDDSSRDAGIAGQGGTTGGSSGTTGGSSGTTGSAGTTGIAGGASSGSGRGGTSGSTGATDTSGAGGSGTGGYGGAGTADAGNDAGVQLSDAQIASVMMTANTGEVQEGQLASSRASARAVRDFGDRMVTDHTKANDMLMTTLQSLSLTPATNPISQELVMQAMQEIADLKKASGSDFDRKYMKAQVLDHMMVLDLIDSTLLPQVDNAVLRRQLMAMRVTVKAHLDSAKQIQKTL